MLWVALAGEPHVMHVAAWQIACLSMMVACTCPCGAVIACAFSWHQMGTRVFACHFA
jgi:hypothetical protein